MELVKETETESAQFHIHQSIRNKLHHFIVTRKIPHLIFHGSSGTGKRTLVYDFINTIYNQDKHKIKTNVMFVNCAHGKGIKFIREELKFFAKTNIQGNCDVLFKTIVLFNADSLTIDAQSALRRCIELFSHNTRFFIVVENKHKLLNPILSRFCEIYVPEHIDKTTNTIVNLHQHQLTKTYHTKEWLEYRGALMADIQREMNGFFSEAAESIKDTEPTLPIRMITIIDRLYSRGASSIDCIEWLQMQPSWTACEKSALLMKFEKIKSEFRCEKLLMFHLLNSFKESLTNVYTM